MFKQSIVLLFISLPFVTEAQNKSKIIVDTSEYIVHTDIIEDNFGKREVGLSDLERMFITKLVQQEVTRYNDMARWVYNSDMRNAKNPQYVPYMCQPVAGKGKRYLIRESSRTSIINSFRDVRPLEDQIIDMAGYQRQYLVKYNEKGEKIVIVYFSCTDHDRLELKHDTMIITRDGGKCYFDVKVNLTTEKLIGFYVNGIA